MCGIAGFLNSDIPSVNAEAILMKMSNAIRMRGPDDFGILYDHNFSLGFSHRRLAIQDLSHAGHQPMNSESDRYAMIFNGEIYNHLAIREEIQAISDTTWRGHSDTETLLRGFEVFGIEDMITKSVGMFSIALWDRVEASLYLIRDRMGEKPLYYGWQSETLLFGSDLASFEVYPSFAGNVDRGALAMLIRQGYINSPYTIYENVNKLEPGTIVKFGNDGKVINTTQYWSVTTSYLAGIQQPLQEQPGSIIEQLEDTLSNAIEKQMLSDVPLGAFLSGGVDSSLVVALMASQSPRKVKTFSIGFHEDGYNEAEHAKLVAKHLNTDHTECYVSASDALNVVPNLATIYSEPFADSSQIPTYLVSKIAKEEVTVALSGDGGDELFCGYERYQQTLKIWKKLDLVPHALRSPLSKLLRQIPASLWDTLLFNLKNNFGDKLHKGLEVLSEPTFIRFYQSLLMSHCRVPEQIVIGAKEKTNPIITSGIYQSHSLSELQQMALFDLNSYLSEDVLTKVDRAAMSVSLETRVPLLDHNVVDFAASIPMNIKFRDNVGKWPLKEVLYKHVPRELIERPKKGFGIPLALWLRTSLRDWAENLLDERKLKEQGYLNSVAVRKYWTEHLSEQRNWGYLLWNILMFQAWLEERKV